MEVKDSKFTDSFDGEADYKEDDFEDEGADPPPPSYDALMRHSVGSTNGDHGGDGLEGFSNIRLSGGDRGLPPLPPPLLPSLHQHNTSERTSGGSQKGSLTSRSAGPSAYHRTSESKEGDFSHPHTSRSAGTVGAIGVAEGTQHGTQQGSLEERAAARRQRVLLLKKQAEERIAEKQQQKLELER